MPDAIVDMNAPPAALHDHAVILDHARDVMIAFQPVLAAKGLSPDEFVVVAVEPEIAAATGRPVVTIEPCEALLRKMKHPEWRAFVAAPVPPGMMRVVVVTRSTTLTLTMNVTAPPTNVIEPPPHQAPD